MKAVLVSALAATVSAEAIRFIARDIVEVRELVPRQDGLDSEECVSAMSSLLPLVSDIPTPPADLVSAMMSVTITDPCNLPTDLPDEVEDEISSYQSVALSWYSEHSAEIDSALSACPAMTSYVSEGPSICTAGGGDDSEDSDAGATGSGSGSSATRSSGSGSTATGSSSSATGTGGSNTTSGANKGVFSAGFAAVAFIAAVFAL